MAMHVVHHCRHALTLQIKNHHIMADYLTPGRGVVKTSGTLKYSKHTCVLLVYSLTWPCMLSITTAVPHTLDIKNHHKMADYLTPGRGVVKTSGTLKYSKHTCVLLVYSLTWPCMLSITTAVPHTLDIKNHHKMADYLMSGRGVVKTSDTLK